MKPIREQALEIAAAKQTASAMLTDEQAYIVPAIFMPWDPTASYAVGDRVRYGGLLYKCIQATTPNPTWTPDAAVSLWARMDDPAIEWPEWRQPTGAQDAYTLGAKVSYNGKHWVSLHAANVWVPGTAGLWEVQA